MMFHLSTGMLSATVSLGLVLLWDVELMMLYLSTGMLSATASLGLVLLWDVDGGLTQIDKYLYSSEDFIKVKKLFIFNETFL